ncbi:hypothetical protein G6F65_019710 [Rhizopus arrhizus]|nr:hypothetical protein G6F65_019710 [Rhizopus arrhizus]
MRTASLIYLGAPPARAKVWPCPGLTLSVDSVFRIFCDPSYCDQHALLLPAPLARPARQPAKPGVRANDAHPGAKPAAHPGRPRHHRASQDGQRQDRGVRPGRAAKAGHEPPDAPGAAGLSRP